jgi:hypothetical protein
MLLCVILILAGTSNVNARTDRDGLWTVEAVTLLEDTNGDTLVAFTLSPTSGWERLSSGEESCFDFEIPPGDPNETTVVEAFLSEGPTTSRVDLSERMPVATWEITPGDHKNGQGGVVRLEFGREVTSVLRNGGIVLMLRIIGRSAEVLRSSLASSTTEGSAE